MAGTSTKQALLEKALLNKNNELAAFRALGEKETLRLMAEAEEKNMAVVFEFDTKTGIYDKITYKFL